MSVGQKRIDVDSVLLDRSFDGEEDVFDYRIL
jgi:hypothetical protein